MPSSTRDKDATWRGIGYVCRERGWSKQRAILELQNGLPVRTVPPGHEHEIDWHDPDQLSRFDLSASTMKIYRGAVVAEGETCFVMGFDTLTVGIEVLPPTDAPPASSPLSPVAISSSPPPSPRKNVSEAEVERCFRDIMKERPDDPPDEEWLVAEMTRRLGASPIRQRVRDMWKRIAPEWKRPVGHPRNNISAKKSAT